MIEFDKVDLCVHRWVRQPMVDLRNPGRSAGSLYRCTRCAWSAKGERRIEDLPAIGRGRIGKTDSGNLREALGCL